MRTAREVIMQMGMAMQWGGEGAVGMERALIGVGH
jgi:hypothetical protein